MSQPLGAFSDVLENSYFRFSGMILLTLSAMGGRLTQWKIAIWTPKSNDTELKKFDFLIHYKVSENKKLGVSQ